MKLLTPYILLVGFYLALWLYCRLNYRKFLLQWKKVCLKLEKSPENTTIIKERDKLLEQFQSFPDCLLGYKIFTFPEEPINLTTQPDNHEGC